MERRNPPFPPKSPLTPLLQRGEPLFKGGNKKGNFPAVFFFVLFQLFTIASAGFCADVKIGGFYETTFCMEKDRRDNQFHLSNFPPLMKLYPWEGNNKLSSWVDVRPPGDSEPNHGINLNFSVTEGEDFSSKFSLIANSNNDIIPYNEASPLYLNSANIYFKKDFFRSYFFVKESPKPFDDPLGLFTPGPPSRFLFEESPMRTSEWPLGWDGRDCQGGEVEFASQNFSARFLGIDRYSKFYTKYDGTKDFADSYYVASRIKRNFSKGKNLLGFSFLRMSWRSDRASSTHEESNWVGSIDGNFLLGANLRFKPQIAQTVGKYVAISDLVFDEGTAWILKLEAVSESSSFSISARDVGRRFSPEGGRFYPNEKGFNMESKFSSPVGKVFLCYDYKTNQENDFPVLDMRAQFRPFENEKTFFNLKFQKINYYYTGSTYDEREILGIKPEVKVPLSQKISALCHIFYEKLEKPIWENPEVSKEYFTELSYSPSKKAKLYINGRFVDNLFTRNLDEYLYFLGEFDKLSQFYPKETQPYYMDPSVKDDWVIRADTLKHFYWGFGFNYDVSGKCFFSASYEKRQPGIDLFSGLVTSTEDIFIAKIFKEF